MKTMIALLLATAAAPAVAQHAGHRVPTAAMDSHTAHQPAAMAGAAHDVHVEHGMAAAPAAAHPAHATPTDPRAAHATVTEPASQVDRHSEHRPRSAQPARHAEASADADGQAAPVADPHGAHGMSRRPATHAGHGVPTAQDPHAGHGMPTAQDPHAGHGVPTAQDPHAGHPAARQESRMPAPAVAPPPPAAYSGPDHAAETIFGTAEMAAAREQLRKEHGAITTSQLLVDLLEVRIHDGRDGYAVDVQAWHGGDINRLWLKAEGEGAFGAKPESAELQALWSRALDPWFNLQAGMRYDVRPDPERAHAVLGVHGLAPYWFEVDGALFLSNKGDLTARFEAEYDQRITQRLILQPRVDFDLAAQDVPALGIGSGLSRVEAGLRLRYELAREFAPYIGINYARAFGDTADFARAASHDVGGWSLIVGVRTWF